MKIWKNYVHNRIYISSITQIIFHHSTWTKAGYIRTEKAVSSILTSDFVKALSHVLTDLKQQVTSIPFS